MNLPLTFRQYIEEKLDIKVFPISKLAKKHNKPLNYMQKQLRKGIKVEKEHTTNTKTAAKIALAHLGEKPNYYELLVAAKL